MYFHVRRPRLQSVMPAEAYTASLAHAELQSTLLPDSRILSVRAITNWAFSNLPLTSRSASRKKTYFAPQTSVTPQLSAF
jgi:hypothetical protein